MINIFTLIINIFYFSIFQESKFTGFKKFLAYTIFFNVVTLCIFIFFKLNVNEELKKENSIIYKVYFFSRILFITFAITSFFIYFLVFYFLFNFEADVDLDTDVKLSFHESIELLRPIINTLQKLNYFVSIISFILVTHQFYWQSFLDQSWCNNNMTNKNRKIKEIVENNKAIEKDSD